MLFYYRQDTAKLERGDEDPIIDRFPFDAYLVSFRSFVDTLLNQNNEHVYMSLLFRAFSFACAWLDNLMASEATLMPLPDRCRCLEASVEQRESV